MKGMEDDVTKHPPEGHFRRFGGVFYSVSEYQDSADFLHYFIEKHSQWKL